MSVMQASFEVGPIPVGQGPTGKRHATVVQHAAIPNLFQFFKKPLGVPGNQLMDFGHEAVYFFILRELWVREEFCETEANLSQLSPCRQVLGRMLETLGNDACQALHPLQRGK